jgi:hypothetical protein
MRLQFAIVDLILNKLYKEEIKNKHYEMVFSEFAERLDMLEQQCHSQDKKALHNLQGWVKSQH